MTTTALEKIQQQNTPGRVGQGTVVEQSRAVAEVEAAIVVALRHPRNIERAVAEMLRSCAQTSLAEKAFFRFSRGEGPISGPSVQLARELARCWGNFQSGLVELRRDDEYRQSEMLAFAWDVQTNTRTSTQFIVPHIRDTKLGPKPLTDMRDVYENNANMGARRLREMIFDQLPVWYTEDAIAACYKTLAGGEKDLPERIQKCTSGFALLGVTVPMLVRKLGSPAEKWTPYDLATLTVIYRSLQRGEVRKEDEFEDAAGRVTATDILQPGQPAVPEPGDGEKVPADAAGQAAADAGEAVPDRCSSGQRNMIAAQFARLGFTAEEEAEVIKAASVLAGRKEFIASTADLTADEATTVRDRLKACKSREDLIKMLVMASNAASEADGDGEAQQ